MFISLHLCWRKSNKPLALKIIYPKCSLNEFWVELVQRIFITTFLSKRAIRTLSKCNNVFVAHQRTFNTIFQNAKHLSAKQVSEKENISRLYLSSVIFNWPSILYIWCDIRLKTGMYMLKVDENINLWEIFNE